MLQRPHECRVKTPTHVTNCAEACTYYSRLQVNHDVELSEAKQYRDDLIQSNKEPPQMVQAKSGFYISSTIKNQGQTGLSYCCATGVLRKFAQLV